MFYYNILNLKLMETFWFLLSIKAHKRILTIQLIKKFSLLEIEAIIINLSYLNFKKFKLELFLHFFINFVNFLIKNKIPYTNFS